MVNSNNPSLINLQQEDPRNLLGRVKQLVLKPDNRSELEQMLRTEMERVDFEFDVLGINLEYTFHYPKFSEVISCFEKNLSILTQMMYVVGKSGKGQEIDFILNYIKSRTEQIIKDFNEIDKVVVNLKLLPLVTVVTGYGLGLLSSQRLPTFHKFFETKTGIQQINSDTRILGYLLPHLWEGRDIRLWKYYLPGGSTELSSIKPNAHNVLLTKMAFLDYLNDKLMVWLSNELDTTIDFESLMCSFKILGSLVYLEKFANNKIESNLYNGGMLDFTCFKFEYNAAFFEIELSMIDKILSLDYLVNLTKSGFKRIDGENLNIFKQFYLELHYLPENWWVMNLNSKSFKE